MKCLGVIILLFGWVALFAAGQEEDAAVHVPPRDLPAYFGGKPDHFLVDPQKLLTPDERQKRERFLEYHAQDSEIDFYVLLFDEGQEIPDGVRVEELAERFFGEGKPALLALYFLGEPQRVRIQLSPRIAEALSPAELGRLREQAVRAAEAKADGPDQLEEFCIQTAIGIFWIEREAGLAEDPEKAEPTGSAPKVVVPKPSRQERMADWFVAWWSEWGIPASVILGGLVAALIARIVYRRRARYRFPEELPPTRLGGDRGAGTGALLEFRSSTRSPSSQKGGPDDPLGGL